MDAGANDPDRQPDRLPDESRPTPGPPALRVSDAERQDTARMLQVACSEGRLTLDELDERTRLAYAATYRTDLDDLVRDLVPAQHTDPSPVHHAYAASSQAPARRVTGGDGPGTTLTVMGGSERRGPWTVPARHSALCLMGGIELDLRQARLQAEDTTIVAITIMGGIQILVPDDVHLEVDGIGLMGGFGEDVGPWRHDPRPVRQAPPGAPRVRVTGFALMGGVGVRRVPAVSPDEDRR